MTRQPIRRRQPAPSWLDGFTHAPGLEAAYQSLEDRLREGRPPVFADAPRVHMEAEWWAL